MTTLAYHLVVLLSIIVLIGLRVAHSASDRRGKRKHSIAFGSCNDAKRQSLWGRMREIQPDSLIMLGDNVYADTKVGAGPGEWTLYSGASLSTRQSVTLRRIIAAQGGLRLYRAGGDGRRLQC